MLDSELYIQVEGNTLIIRKSGLNIELTDPSITNEQIPHIREKILQENFQSSLLSLLGIQLIRTETESMSAEALDKEYVIPSWMTFEDPKLEKDFREFFDGIDHNNPQLFLFLRIIIGFQKLNSIASSLSNENDNKVKYIFADFVREVALPDIIKLLPEVIKDNRTYSQKLAEMFTNLQESYKPSSISSYLTDLMRPAQNAISSFRNAVRSSIKNLDVIVDHSFKMSDSGNRSSNIVIKTLLTNAISFSSSESITKIEFAIANILREKKTPSKAWVEYRDSKRK